MRSSRFGARSRSVSLALVVGVCLLLAGCRLARVPGVVEEYATALHSGDFEHAWSLLDEFHTDEPRSRPGAAAALRFEHFVATYEQLAEVHIPWNDFYAQMVWESGRSEYLDASENHEGKVAHAPRGYSIWVEDVMDKPVAMVVNGVPVEGDPFDVDDRPHWQVNLTTFQGPQLVEVQLANGEWRSVQLPTPDDKVVNTVEPSD